MGFVFNKWYYTHNAAYKVISYKSQSTVGLIIKRTIDFKDITDNENAPKSGHMIWNVVYALVSLCSYGLVLVL